MMHEICNAQNVFEMVKNVSLILVLFVTPVFWGGGLLFPFWICMYSIPPPPQKWLKWRIFFFKKSFPKSENFVKQHATRFCIVYSDTNFTIFCTTLFHLSRDRWEARDSGLRFLGSFRGGLFIYIFSQKSQGESFLGGSTSWTAENRQGGLTLIPMP